MENHFLVRKIAFTAKWYLLEVTSIIMDIVLGKTLF